MVAIISAVWPTLTYLHGGLHNTAPEQVSVGTPTHVPTQHIPTPGTILPQGKGPPTPTIAIGKTGYGNNSSARLKLAPQTDPPKSPVAAVPTNVDEHARLAAEFLQKSVPEHEWHNIQFLTLYHRTPEEGQRAIRIFRWLIYQMTTEIRLSFPKQVPGAVNLWWINISDYRWTRTGMNAVAERDPYCTQPSIGNYAASFLRKAAVYEVPKRLADKELFPVGAMIRLDFLMRDVQDTTRSTSLYDLLYSRERFKEQRVKTGRTIKMTWPGGPDSNGKHFPAGYEYDADEYRTEVVVNNFPANEADWDKFWGIDIAGKFIDDRKLNLRHGAVAPGFLSDPKGSIVSFNDRVVRQEPTAAGLASFKSFDSDKTAGEFDYRERAPEIALGKIKSKGGEFLVTLPGGGQATLLINEDRKRIEVAVTTVVRNSLDPTFVDVRNGSCFICHAPDQGFITPRNLSMEDYKAGVRPKFIDPKTGHRLIEDENAYYAFYKDWDYKISTWKAPYQRLIDQTTQDTKGKALTAVEISDEMLWIRKLYDAPLTPQEFANEIGMPLPEMKLLIASENPAYGKYNTTVGTRLSGLVQGIPIPRSVVEFSEFRNMAKVLDARRKPIK